MVMIPVSPLRSLENALFAASSKNSLVKRFRGLKSFFYRPKKNTPRLTIHLKNEIREHVNEGKKSCV